MTSHRRAKCPACGRLFKNARGLSVHQRTHAAEEAAAAALIPDPPDGRPLAAAGLELWTSVHAAGAPAGNLELLIILCEQLDERRSLRARVILKKDPRDRAGLRVLEDAIAVGLRELGLAPTIAQADVVAEDWTTRLAGTGSAGGSS